MQKMKTSTHIKLQSIMGFGFENFCGAVCKQTIPKFDMWEVFTVQNLKPRNKDLYLLFLTIS